MPILDLRDDAFDDAMAAIDIPVLIDFWAPWCGPCRQLSPIIERLAEQFEGRVQVVKINIDDSPELGARFEVTSVPTLVVMVGGDQVERSGMLPPPKIRSMLERHLA